MSMCDAERRFLGNALPDISNEWFVLLSESCLTLRNFSTVYKYLSGCRYSFIGSVNDLGPYGRGRYDRRMLSEVSIEQWRKGPQCTLGGNRAVSSLTVAVAVWAVRPHSSLEADRFSGSQEGKRVAQFAEANRTIRRSESSKRLEVPFRNQQRLASSFQNLVEDTSPSFCKGYLKYAQGVAETTSGLACRRWKLAGFRLLLFSHAVWFTKHLGRFSGSQEGKQFVLLAEANCIVRWSLLGRIYAKVR
ncbi:hypothetical protein KSP40_PGU017980 [Platanthera guangdongensis]|uniref:Uncharacterized protein n=1 Tax=Platanthera guangdongensis TaxID=2320717 RepID=A0ABR2LMG0_9ASPA